MKGRSKLIQVWSSQLEFHKMEYIAGKIIFTDKKLRSLCFYRQDAGRGFTARITAQNKNRGGFVSN